LVPVRKQPGLKAGAFSPALLVPVATTGINGRYKPEPMAFFPPVCRTGSAVYYIESNTQPIVGRRDRGSTNLEY
jgi:hypothetical protein